MTIFRCLRGCQTEEGILPVLSPMEDSGSEDKNSTLKRHFLRLACGSMVESDWVESDCLDARGSGGSILSSTIEKNKTKRTKHLSGEFLLVKQSPNNSKYLTFNPHYVHDLLEASLAFLLNFHSNPTRRVLFLVPILRTRKPKLSLLKIIEIAKELIQTQCHTSCSITGWTQRSFGILQLSYKTHFKDKRAAIL